MLEEAQIPRKLVRRKVEGSKANEVRQTGRNFPGIPVVSEVENLKLPAVNNLRWDFVNEVVVNKRDLFELGEPP
ncbi:leucine-rich repeat receptor-like serine/threonine/tyrosine-protein kinase SOBIR1 [Pyrus ussuriensis x Pyrus communis]|uniref:Leucine-rich repeat receptor-like serine/threonine/tyrosine-protein kinase SOBIR1 n=1 Tax=Pyrus ussuriensis x Pyrus communis TaxID=2448454 RepID=A0A5N5G752_9ROSA|nr:leucine-rich repeat receptor-like serine/threonine/tyrosine-protein kinase SOBIR1 [Pyrus ussuriensis x Pyrus communis]